MIPYIAILSLLFCVAGITASEQSVAPQETAVKGARPASRYCPELQCWSRVPCLQHVPAKTTDENNNPVPVTFVSKYNGNNKMNPYVLIATLVKEYIGNAHQSVMYCLGHKSYTLLQGKTGQLMDDGYQQVCAPELSMSSDKQLKVKYEREKAWNQLCAPTTNPGRVLAYCEHVIPLNELLNLRDKSVIDKGGETGDCYYSPEYFPAKRTSNTAHIRELQIAAWREVFGTTCLPQQLAGTNGHAIYSEPFLITAQHDRLNLFELHEERVPASAYHTKIDAFFAKLGGLKKQPVVRIPQLPGQWVIA